MTSRFLGALSRGGTVTDIARRSGVDPELVRIAADHQSRLSATSRCVSGCPTSRAEAPIGCKTCPLLPLSTRR